MPLSVGLGLGLTQVLAAAGATIASDTTPPVVSNVVVDQITGSSARIRWDTNEPATGQIRYGPTATYGIDSGVETLPTTSHSITLTGLTDGVTYHYQIVSVDVAGNRTELADATFATPDVTGPAITAVSGSETKRATRAAGAEVTVLWQTALELGDSKVEYGTVASGAFGSATAVTNTSPRVNAHSVVVQGLVANTPYQFRPVSVDAAGNSITGAVVLVTTEWTPALSGAALTHHFEPDFLAIASATQVQNPVDHSGQHVGLPQQTTAAAKPTFYRGDATKANGVACLSLDGVDDNYTTVDVDVDDWDHAGDYTEIFVFKSYATAADKFLWCRYNTDNTIIRAIKQKVSGALAVFENTKGTDQVTAATDYADGTNYAVIIRRSGTTVTVSRNGSLNTDTFTGMANTAATGGARIGTSRNSATRMQVDLIASYMLTGAISDADCNLYFDYFYRHGFITNPDLRAPVLVGTPTATETAVATGGAGASVRFDWVNDENSSSIVKYSLNSDMSSATTSSETDTSPRVTTHARTLSGFLPNRTYYYQVQSRDAAGNTMTGPIGSFATTATLEAIPGLRYWMDMSLQAGTDATTLQTITDFGPDNVVLTQGTAGSRATLFKSAMHGAPCLRFAGSHYYESAGDVNTLDLAGAKTIVVVYRADALAANCPFIGHFDTTPFTTRWQTLLTSGGALRMQTSGGGSDDTSLTGFADGYNHAAVWKASAAGALQVYADSGVHDAFTGTTNTAPTGKVRIGVNGAEPGTVFAACDIGMIAVFDAELTDPQLEIVWNWIGGDRFRVFPPAIHVSWAGAGSGDGTVEDAVTGATPQGENQRIPHPDWAANYRAGAPDLPQFTGTDVYVDPVGGSDANDGLSTGAAKATFMAGYNLLVSGHFDKLNLMAGTHYIGELGTLSKTNYLVQALLGATVRFDGRQASGLAFTQDGGAVRYYATFNCAHTASLNSGQINPESSSQTFSNTHAQFAIRPECLAALPVTVDGVLIRPALTNRKSTGAVCNIVSITKTSAGATTATVVTSSAHELSTGDDVLITNVSTATNQVGYNGCFAVTVVNSTTFTIAVSAASTGATSATAANTSLGILWTSRFSVTGTPTFFHAENQNRLYYGADPAGKTIKAAVKTNFAAVTGSGAYWRGCLFTHYANRYGTPSGSNTNRIIAAGNGQTWVNNAFGSSPGDGFTGGGAGTVFEENQSFWMKTGQSSYANGAVIYRCTARYMNWFYGDRPGWHCGLAKAVGVGVANSTVRECHGQYANGPIYWCDFAAENHKILNNRGDYAVKMGVSMEINTATAALPSLVAGNLFTDCYWGLGNTNSKYIHYVNNTCFRCGTPIRPFGDAGRSDGNILGETNVVENTLVVMANGSRLPGMYLLAAVATQGGSATQNSATWFDVFDYNVIHKPSDVPTAQGVFWWKSGAGNTVYTSRDSWRTAMAALVQNHGAHDPTPTSTSTALTTFLTNPTAPVPDFTPVASLRTAGGTLTAAQRDALGPWVGLATTATPGIGTRFYPGCRG